MHLPAARFFAALALGSSALSSPAQAPQPLASSPRQAATPAAQQMHERMQGDLRAMQAIKLSGDVDRDFAMMMRLHHQQAVEMGQFQLRHGKSPELRTLAQDIVNAQRREIEQLEKYLAGTR